VHGIAYVKLLPNGKWQGRIYVVDHPDLTWNPDPYNTRQDAVEATIDRCWSLMTQYPSLLVVYIT
jgi:hypothetical protein